VAGATACLLARLGVQRAIAGLAVRKVVVVPGKIVNIVVG
jgi:leucyl-tRNA synthetase